MLFLTLRSYITICFSIWKNVALYLFCIPSYFSFYDMENKSL